MKSFRRSLVELDNYLHLAVRIEVLKRRAQLRRLPERNPSHHEKCEESMCVSHFKNPFLSQSVLEEGPNLSQLKLLSGRGVRP